jgi:hypothetical protein
MRGSWHAIEVVDDELTASFERVEHARLAIGSLEEIDLPELVNGASLKNFLSLKTAIPIESRPIVFFMYTRQPYRTAIQVTSPLSA